MSNLDLEYCRVLDELVKKSETTPMIQDRTGVGTWKIFGNMIRIDISESFPMLLSRRVPWKSVVNEFIFFLNGFTNNNWLRERNCKYWEEFAHPETGELGPVYGAQLRNFNNQGVDQLALLIDGLQNRPNSRRHMFTYFNPAVVPDETKTHKENIENGRAVLPPCHLLYQFNVEDGKLSGLLYQRSADFCIGSSSNIAQMGLWIYFLARVCGYKPGELVYVTGDTHIYSNHIGGAKEVIRNAHLISNINYPQLKLDPQIGKCNVAEALEMVSKLNEGMFVLEDYIPVGVVKFPLAV
jgi:thymidylate synthase